jgi:hypothetical protein
VLHLHFPNGELIRTTPEHPFFVEGEGKGWTVAGSLKAGDRLIIQLSTINWLTANSQLATCELSTG